MAIAARRDRNWPHCGEILFENVTLHYENSFTPALDRLTLSVPAGTKVDTPCPQCLSLPRNSAPEA
jgi:ABC-type multidrug transport system fused ATPase/permease subunit